MLILFILLSIFNFYIDKNINTIQNFINNNNIFKNIIFKRYDFLSPDINKYQIEETTVKKLELNEENLNKFCGEQRIQFGTNYTKKPVIVFGCSYAYGHGLKKEQTFPYLLSEQTKRPVYNFSGCGGNIIQSYNNLQRYNDFPNVSDTEYIIYIYMHDHINRYLTVENIYTNYYFAFPKSNNKIKENLLKIPLFRFIYAIIQEKKIIMNEKNADLFIKNGQRILKNIIKNTYKELKKEAPNAKMIIILYDEKMPDMYYPVRIMLDSEIQNSDIWDEIEKETDIKVVRTKDLTGFLFDKDYKLKEDIADWHPNEKAWKVFTPLFVKKYMI